MVGNRAPEEPYGQEAPRERLVKVPIAFPEELYEWLRQEAFIERTKMAVIVRQALQEYRERVVAPRESSTEENR